MSIRSPWYDEQNKVIGLVNTSITLGKHLFSKALTHIANLTLLKIPSQKNLSLNENIFLTSREKQVAYHLVRGGTAKLIAEKLFISPRTVEVHIDNIKNKLGVDTKAQLIEKLLIVPS